MEYKAAVIGCGRIGSLFDKDPKRKFISTHIGAYQAAKGVRLSAICDLDPARLKECKRRWGIENTYTDFMRMLKNEKPDILSISTPPETHYPILKKAVDFPLKAIFCEKPIATNLGQARSMVELCKRKKIILQINHQRRFDPLHLNLRRMIRGKGLGLPRQANFYYTAGIYNSGSHMFDLLRFFFGEAEWIESFSSNSESRREGDPNLDGLIKFKSGTMATFQASDARNFLIFEMNCILDHARFILGNSGLSLDFYRAGESKILSGYRELVKVKPPFALRYKRNSMVNAVENLIQCVNKKRESVSSGEEGSKSLELILAAARSAGSSGRRIYLGELKCQA